MKRDTITVEVSVRRPFWLRWKTKGWETKMVEVPVPAEMRERADHYHSRTGWGV